METIGLLESPWRLPIWAFRKIRGTVFGVLIIRILLFRLLF